MDIQLKKGVLDLCVLHILNKEDSYGYDISEKITKFVDVSEGTVYPILRKLKEGKFLTTYLQPSNDGPPRVYYKITEQGKQRYDRLLKDWQTFNKKINSFIGGKNE